MRRRWDLAGRDVELAAAQNAIVEGTGVYVAGARGMGRSRLANEIAARVPMRMVRVTATSAARSTPFGAFHHLVQGEGAKDFAGVRSAILGAGGDRPLLLIDDAHLLDDMSASLALQLAIDEQAILVVTTAPAPTPDAVTALWKDGYLTRIDIGPLTDEVIASFVDIELRPAVDAPARHALVSAAAGSPQALEHLIDDAKNDGSLHLRDQVWRHAGPLGRGGRSGDLLLSWMPELSLAAVDALEVMAVADRSIGSNVADRLVEPSALDELDASGHLRSVASGTRVEVALERPLAAAVRARLSPLRVRRLSHRLAEAMALEPRRRARDLVTLVELQLDAGIGVDPATILAAALDASRSLDDDAALHLARQAWTSTRRVDAGHLLGRLLWATGRHEEAEVVLADVADRAPDDEALVHVTNTRVTNLFRGLHDGPASEAVFTAARSRLDDGECRDVLEAHQAAIEFLCGDVRSASARTEPLLDEAKPWTFVEAAVAAAPARALQGRTDAAVSLAERAYTIYAGLAPRKYAQDNAGIHLMTLTTAFVYAGRLDDADSLAAACYDAAVAAGTVGGSAWFALLRGTSAEQRGSLRSARAWFVEAADSFDQSGESGMRRVALSHAALVAAMSGDGAFAASALEVVDGLSHSAVVVYDTTAVRAHAWAHVATGNRRIAHDLLERAAAQDLDGGRVSLAVDALHDLARIGEPERANALFATMPDVDGRLLPLKRDHVAALTGRDASPLESVAERFEEIGARLFAAEALAVAAKRRVDTGGGRTWLALRRRAAELAAQCPDASTPAIAALRTIGSRLTRREDELVALAAGPMSNKEIAAVLGVSIRTVENHLGRAYAKLGVRSRGELADIGVLD